MKKNGYKHVVRPGPIASGTRFWYRQLGATDGMMPVVVESSYETPGGRGLGVLCSGGVLWALRQGPALFCFMGLDWRFRHLPDQVLA